MAAELLNACREFIPGFIKIGSQVVEKSEEVTIIISNLFRVPIYVSLSRCNDGRRVKIQNNGSKPFKFLKNLIYTTNCTCTISYNRKKLQFSVYGDEIPKSHLYFYEIEKVKENENKYRTCCIRTIGDKRTEILLPSWTNDDEAAVENLPEIHLATDNCPNIHLLAGTGQDVALKNELNNVNVNELVNCENDNEEVVSSVSALHFAACNGHASCVRPLLVHGAEIDQKDGNLWTPLHYASFNGHGDVVQLLERGPDIIILIRTSIAKRSMTLFIHSIKVVVGLLKRGADIDAADEDGCTPLHHAFSNGHAKVIELLLQNGANINAVNKVNCTPLDYDFFNEYDKVVELFGKNNQGGLMSLNTIFWGALLILAYFLITTFPSSPIYK